MQPALAPLFVARIVWVWIVLGVLGIAYMALCPPQYHRSYMDFLAGLLAGIAVVACFVRAPKA